MAIDLTAYLARHEPDQYVKDVFDFGLLEQALSGQGEMLAGARRAHALLASIFNAISDAIIVTDAAGRITQANDAVLRLFNRASGYTVGL